MLFHYFFPRNKSKQTNKQQQKIKERTVTLVHITALSKTQRNVSFLLHKCIETHTRQMCLYRGESSRRPPQRFRRHRWATGGKIHISLLYTNKLNLNNRADLPQTSDSRTWTLSTAYLLIRGAGDVCCIVTHLYEKYTAAPSDCVREYYRETLRQVNRVQTSTNRWLHQLINHRTLG